MSDKLVDALDAGAAKLLEMAMAETKNPDGTINPTTLAERVKAFEAVTKWAETRLAVAPKEVKRSQFDELRDQFNDKPTIESGAAQRRGPTRKTTKTKVNGSTEQHDGSGVNSADPANDPAAGFLD